MKLFMHHVPVFTVLSILLMAVACNEPAKNEPVKEKAYPTLIKTIGNPRYGNVQCSLQDRAGNLWFGTTENGLYKYDARRNEEVGQPKSFTRYLSADGLISDNILALLEDKNGRIWIGTDSGLCIYDAQLPHPGGSRENDHVGHPTKFRRVDIPLRKNLPPNKYRNTHEVFSIMEDRSGKIWFATIDGVYIYEDKVLPGGADSFRPFIIDADAMGYMSTNNNAEHILQDKAGNIWFGGRGTHGVYRYDGISVINIKLPELLQDGPTKKPHDWAWPQLQDKDGYIWFSNWGGVYRLDPSSLPVNGSPSVMSFTKKDGLSADMVARIIEDKNGSLWFGGAGLTRYDGKSFTRFSAKDGLPNLGVWLLLEDDAGNIWIGTRETGLYLYDGKKFITCSEYRR